MLSGWPPAPSPQWGQRRREKGVSASSSLDAPGWIWPSPMEAGRGEDPPGSHHLQLQGPKQGVLSRGRCTGQWMGSTPARERGKGELPKPGRPASQPQPGPAKNHPHEPQLLAKSCPTMQVVHFPSPPPIFFRILLFLTFSTHSSCFWEQAASSSRVSPTTTEP